MGKAVICMGDSTSHGGKVLEGLPHATIHGKPIAALGHKVFCPQCKGTFPIIEGVPFHTFAGKNTAVEGMHTACGATLIASQHDMTIDCGGSSEQSGSANESAAERVAGDRDAPVDEPYDQHFQLVDLKGRPLNDLPYILHVGPETVARGRTCKEGLTHRLEAGVPLQLSVTILEEVTPINPDWDR